MVLHDTNLDLFERFLKDLYTGSLTEKLDEKAELSTDDMYCLLTFADKYEVKIFYC